MRVVPFSRFLVTLISLNLIGGSVPKRAFAWNASGHMTIGTIAEARLNANARQVVTRLLAEVRDPRSADFTTAGVWMDDIRADGVRLYDRWHYHNRAHSPDGTPTPAAPHPDNVAWAIEQNLLVLKSAKTSDAEKARALRFLLHTVQDIHNPLHCGSRYTKDNPDGDSGGNQFALEKSGSYRNLHAFWDAALGTFPAAERPLAKNNALARKLAQELTTRYPASSLPESALLDPHKWVDEGYGYLTTVVYPNSATPDPDYLSRCRPIAERRAALAGYRLANLLNALWP